MGKMQREKGERGMREVVNILREQFPGSDPEKRSQYRGGKKDGCDIHFAPFGIEVKRMKSTNPKKALEQAEEDCSSLRALDAGCIHPLAWTRDDGKRWIVTMESHVFLSLLRDAGWIS